MDSFALCTSQFGLLVAASRISLSWILIFLVASTKTRETIVLLLDTTEPLIRWQFSWKYLGYVYLLQRVEPNPIIISGTHPDNIVLVLTYVEVEKCSHSQILVELFSQAFEILLNQLLNIKENYDG